MFALLSGSSYCPPLSTPPQSALRPSGDREASERTEADLTAVLACSASTAPSSSTRLHSDTLFPSSPRSPSRPSSKQRPLTARVSAGDQDSAEDAQPTSVKAVIAHLADDKSNKENQPTKLPAATRTSPSLACKPHSFSALSSAQSDHSIAQPRTDVSPPATAQPATFAYTTTEWKPEGSSTAANQLPAHCTANRPVLLTSTYAAGLPSSSCPASLGCALRFMGGLSAGSPELSIPDEFVSVVHYQQTFVAAMSEQINDRLTQLANRFRAATQRLLRAANTATAQHSSAATTPQQRDRDAQSAYRSARIHYYHQGALQIRRLPEQTQRKKPTHKQRVEDAKRERQRQQRKHGRAARTWRKGEEQMEEDENEEEGELAAEEALEGPADGQKDGSLRLWLVLADVSSKEKSQSYRKHDLWLLSNDPLFGWRDETQPRHRFHKPWVMFVLSEYRSFADRTGRMQVRLLAVEGSTVHDLPIDRQTHVYGIRAASLALEMRHLHCTLCTA